MGSLGLACVFALLWFSSSSVFGGEVVEVEDYCGGWPCFFVSPPPKTSPCGRHCGPKPTPARKSAPLIGMAPSTPPAVTLGSSPPPPPVL
ncbi:hypothetical protein AMTRI_Chr12g275150 [Amborella trichopoda]|uniref:Secreted protein n=1 Tax=Amborella trichopoda TaxID=13333 RepID=W1PI63_AMBTC|nr:hypothetical protein AMTR_s00019p00247160 [Amborella trichopoda]